MRFLRDIELTTGMRGRASKKKRDPLAKLRFGGEVALEGHLAFT